MTLENIAGWTFTSIPSTSLAKEASTALANEVSSAVSKEAGTSIFTKIAGATSAAVIAPVTAAVAASPILFGALLGGAAVAAGYLAAVHFVIPAAEKAVTAYDAWKTDRAVAERAIEESGYANDDTASAQTKVA